MKAAAKHSPTADLHVAGTLIEVKTGLNAVRGVRAALLDLAYALQDEPASKRGLLVLVEPRITPTRLAQEWELASKTFRPSIGGRLGMVLIEQDKLQELSGNLEPAVRNRLRQIARKEMAQPARNLPRVEYHPEILKILLHEWLLCHGPITAERLAKFAGCTYPTVASALRRLTQVLLRHSDRSVELGQFPAQAWAGLLASGDRTRHTLRFADRSGTPRSPDLLIRRLARLGRSDIAIGGVVGAKSLYRNLDIVGVPRLDITLHCPQNQLDTSFVQQADPALVLTGSHDEPAALVVHVIRRKESFFTPGLDVVPRADPVECLLDLHEMHLETQAQELFSYFAKQRSSDS